MSAPSSSIVAASISSSPSRRLCMRHRRELASFSLASAVASAFNRASLMRKACSVSMAGSLIMVCPQRFAECPLQAFDLIGLLEHRSGCVRRRALASIASHEENRQPPRDNRISNWIDSLPTKVDIEHGDVKGQLVRQLERRFQPRGRADHLALEIRKHVLQGERHDRLVFNYKYT